MSIRWFETLIIFIFAFGLSSGQLPHFSSQDYPGGEITFLFEDQQGFVWIGSERDLYRFDGISYQAFNQNGDPLHFTCMYQDRNRRFWVGTGSGQIFHLDGESYRLELWEPEEGLPKAKITGIDQDTSGIIWIGTYGEGIYLWQEEVLYNVNTDDGLIDNDIYDIASDSSGSIWVATDNGVNICQFINREKHIKKIDRTNGLVDEIVYDLQSDGAGMWLGFDAGGFCYYQFENGLISQTPTAWTHGPTKSIRSTSSDMLYVINDEGEIYHVDLKGDFKASKIDVPLSSQNVALLIDGEQNIWLGSDDQIFVAAGNISFVSHNLSDVQALLKDREGTLWTGTRSGLYQYYEDRFLPFLPNRNIISLHEDPYQNLWAGTFGDGVFVMSKDYSSIRNFSERDGLTNGSVLSIDGNDERIWLATLGGITEISMEHDPLSQSSFQYLNLNSGSGSQANFIYRIFIDSKDVVWIATDGNGVLKFENEVIVSLIDRKLLLVKTAYCFAEDRQGNLWIGTAEEGLCMFDGKDATFYNRSDGMSSHSIIGIEIDEYDRIMAVHSEGIDLLDPGSGLIIKLGNQDGLEDFNPSLNSTHLGPDQNIWIGDDNTLIEYDALPPSFPRMVLDKVQSLDQIIDQKTKGAFSWKNNFIQFYANGLWFSDPKAISYSYRLEGNDPLWRESSNPFMSYARLSPGIYNFKIKPVLYGQIIDSSEVSYSFKIIPPLWQRSWVLILFGVMLMVLLYYYQKRREDQINRKAAIHRAQVESQFELLKAQIDPHFLFNSFNTLATLVEEDSELAVEYIEKLSDYYRSIIQSRNKKVATLKEELGTITDYYYLLKKRFGDNLSLQISIKDDSGYIPLLSLQMLLENAIKHNTVSRKHPLVITIERENDQLCISNRIQPKLTETKSTKFGLQNLKNQYQLLSKQEIKIENSNGKFSVIIPILKNNHEDFNN